MATQAISNGRTFFNAPVMLSTSDITEIIAQTKVSFGSFSSQ
jgi:hypothetical protein